ncbi:hypothetical protein GCM10023149_29250 [Mucilaginibacter gynuensis]|uniref:Uncharacterized protein n=1 Tax=Mucilaginibacter gynuensis TaxID=1302236 RepID=A0ABP8GM39_9SPHI
MRILLTPDLLDFLIRQGYRYCLCKTYPPDREKVRRSIVLTPLTQRAWPAGWLMDHDALFDLRREPARMAEGIDDFLVFVNVPGFILLAYLDAVVNPFDFSGHYKA